LWRRLEVLRSCGNQFRAIKPIIRRIGNPLCASEFLPNCIEVIELIGVPGAIRTLVCAEKAMCPDVSYWGTTQHGWLPKVVSVRFGRASWIINGAKSVRGFGRGFALSLHFQDFAYAGGSSRNLPNDLAAWQRHPSSP